MEQYNRNLNSETENAETMLQTILTECDKRQENKCTQCTDCKFGEFCPHDCEKCLEYIHFPKRVPQGAPKRKYDCPYMADFYTCKYACKYASEIIYAIRRDDELMTKEHLNVLSFGCGPCTDLFAIDYLKRKGEMQYKTIEYRGIDYSEDVWRFIHRDIKSFENESCKIKFYYADICKLMDQRYQLEWKPNLIVFHYVFSDMQKNTDQKRINNFINRFAQYCQLLPSKTSIILNDINLSNNKGGGRDYFDLLGEKLKFFTVRKGRFCNYNSTSSYCPRGYPYGEESDGEFSDNRILFNSSMWQKYSPFESCASAQMLIKKEAGG